MSRKFGGFFQRTSSALEVNTRLQVEHPETAHKDGVIALINAEIGATVSSGTILLEIAD